jgi:serine/threonine protein phosphatase PrpC
MTLALRYAIRSDVGLLREGNEDSAYAGPHLLAIADGMGGHAAGEVASAVAVAALAPLDQDFPDDAQMLDSLASAVSSASGTLHDMSMADPSVEGMGTTVTAILWSDGRIALCHIGDSRAYLLRDGELRQITRDHTLIQSLVDEGRLSPAAAANHPQRSLIMRALQGSADVQPDLSMLDAEQGDRYLLCSDGLSDVVTDETLAKTLLDYSDLDEAVLQLIELAIRGGGPDNITCIVADVVDTVTGPVAPSSAPVIAGAASSTDGSPTLRDDSPAGRAHLLTQGPRADGYQQDWPQQHDGGGDDPDGEDDDEGYEPRGSRRRWPVVTASLAILIVVIVGGGYGGWRYTQSQYYVGAAAGQVAIFRGINQSVAGFHLSSVAVRTGIPLSHVVQSDLDNVNSTITVSSMAEARKTVLNIKNDYSCQIAVASVQKWEAGKPKPHKVTRKVHGKKVTKTITPPYRAKPRVPSFCSPAQGASG